MEGIPALVDAAARQWPDAEALVEQPPDESPDRPGVRLTFTDLAAEMRRSLRAMLAAGIEPGDRVSIWAPNISEWVVAALGVLGAGGVVVPLNTRFKGAEAGYVLEKSGARMLLTVNGFLGTDYVQMLRDSGVALPALERIVVLRGDVPEGTTSWDEMLAAGDEVAPDVGEARLESIRDDDLSDMMFTSGTTGHPKGVMLTHGQSVRVYRAWTDVIGLRAGDRYLIVNPFFHTFGYKAGWMSCIMRGATIVPHLVFDVPQVLARVAEEHITVLPGPPTLLLSILNFPDRDDFDLSSLRLTVTGAAVVPVELIRRLRDEMTFETIITGYGLTETTGTTTMCRHDDDPETIANWSGRAIPDTEVRVVDDEGDTLPTMQPGEVVVRGYNVMRGYYDEPEETAATIDAGGWLHTGDIGVMDDRGYVRITDRKKDMFIAGGFNAYPAEIEGLLLRHPAVAQVAVVGVPEERLGEVGMAFVVPRPGQTVVPDELIAWARDEMANYKVPRYVEVVNELPLNASGKVVKYELRARAQEALAARTSG